MDAVNRRRALIWGGLMIVGGVMMLVQQVTDVSPWVWVTVLGVFGFVALVLGLGERFDWPLLLTSYIVFAIAGLITLVTVGWLDNESPAFYVLGAVALPFFVLFLVDRSQWWGLIPGYVLLAVSIMIYLIVNDLLRDLMVPAYILFAIALPFFVVFIADFRRWWALIPAGILSILGLAFFLSTGFLYLINYIGAAVLIGLGIVVLARVILKKDPRAADLPEVIEPADDLEQP